jgi:hypothetical protein
VWTLGRMCCISTATPSFQHNGLASPDADHDMFGDSCCQHKATLASFGNTDPGQVPVI